MRNTINERLIEEYPFSGYLKKYENGRLDVEMTEGELWSIDFPKDENKTTQPPDYRSFEKALLELEEKNLTIFMVY